MSEQDAPPPDARKVLVSVNPTAGSTPAEVEVRRLAELLRVRGFDTEGLTDLAEVARRADRMHGQGALRALVSVGGDGTVAELVNRTRPGVPITILPTGNENLLARHLGLRRSAEELAETIVGGRLTRRDAGRAGGRLFVLMIGCGFDAEVVRRFEQQRTGHAGHLAYVRPILGALAHYEYSKMLIYCDESSPTDRAAQAADEACWLFAFNLPCYGGGLRFVPEANPADGLLDVCTFRRGSTWHGLRYFSALVLRRHERLADCRRSRVRRLRVEGRGRVPYQLDGDFAGYLPVDIEAVPGRLTFLAPFDSPRRCEERGGETNH